MLFSSNLGSLFARLQQGPSVLDNPLQQLVRDLGSLIGADEPATQIPGPQVSAFAGGKLGGLAGRQAATQAVRAKILRSLGGEVRRGRLPVETAGTEFAAANRYPRTLAHVGDVGPVPLRERLGGTYGRTLPDLQGRSKFTDLEFGRVDPRIGRTALTHELQHAGQRVGAGDAADDLYMSLKRQFGYEGNPLEKSAYARDARPLGANTNLRQLLDPEAIQSATQEVADEANLSMGRRLLRAFGLGG